jgi:hypothetical protein
VISIIDKLERDHPLFHNDGKGGITTWNSGTILLRAIENLLNRSMKTLEIGSGYSTVMFIYKGCCHTCISADPDEAIRIKAYCEESGMTIDRIEFITGESHTILNNMAHEEFDLVFIDGAHRFPFPIVDWFYSAMLLKKDGLIIIDDTDIISCNMLLKFMKNDPHWEPLDVRNNFGIFLKKGNHNYPMDWCGQPFSKDKISIE